METFDTLTKLPRKEYARKMYYEGYDVYLLPCKMRKDNAWVLPFKITKYDSTEKYNRFDRTVDSYVFYNCNAELGYYPHYYVDEKDYEEFRSKNDVKR